MSQLEPTGPNAAQIEFWNGETGTAWAANQARMDALLAPLSSAALEALAPKRGERVLDVGCGCGSTTLEIAASGARATGIDVSAPMLELARRRAAERQLDVDFVLADASEHVFPERFDALFSRFGVMFFADAAAAFANLRGALVPDGRVTFICWQEARVNPWISLPIAAARPYLPEMPPVDPREPGPFAFADISYVNDVLARAGFERVRVRPCEADLTLGNSLEEALQFTTRMGPLSRLLANAEPDAVARATSAVREALAQEAKDGELRLRARAWIVHAHGRA